MFGHHSKGKSSKPEKESAEMKASKAADKAQKSAEERKANRERGFAETEEFLKRETEGLNPETKKALQYEANKNIQRSMQSAGRQLLGDQAMHGIVGKGGVGYAQQRDVYKLGEEARGQAERDIRKLDSDLALKKQAAIYAGGQGEAAQAQLDKQMEIDAADLLKEKKRQRKFEKQFNDYMTRI